MELKFLGIKWILMPTVVILINATTLMHKSTLNTNNFGNNQSFWTEVPETKYS